MSLLYQGLVRDQEVTLGHYVKTSVLITQSKKLSEKKLIVQAYDYNTLGKMQPLEVPRKVLYESDLKDDELYRKIDLDTAKNSIAITKYCSYKMKEERVRSMLVLDEYKLKCILKIQSFFRMIREKNYFKLVCKKNEELRLINIKSKVIHRFFKLQLQQMWIFLVLKPREEDKVTIKASVWTDDKIKSVPLDFYSKLFKQQQFLKEFVEVVSKNASVKFVEY